MADKKMTAAEKKAAEEAAAQAEADRKATERNRLVRAGAVLGAIALFVGGYAVGASADDDDSIIGSDVVLVDPGGRPGPFGDRPGEHFPGPRGGFDDDFEFPEGFEFPPYSEFPEGFEFPHDFEFPPGPRGGFEFHHDLEFPPGRGAFGFECTPAGDLPGGFRCEFTFPEGFEFPEMFPSGPFFEDELLPDEVPDDAVPAEPGFLGVGIVEGPDGITVVEIFPGSAADDFGFALDDVIVAVDGVELQSAEDLATAIGHAGAGTEVTITVIRNGEEENLDVVLGFPPN